MGRPNPLNEALYDKHHADLASECQKSHFLGEDVPGPSCRGSPSTSMHLNLPSLKSSIRPDTCTPKRLIHKHYKLSMIL